MIKIREEIEEHKKRVIVTLENKEEQIFGSYPIVIRSKDVKASNYEVQKKISGFKDVKRHESRLEKVKERALEVKDSTMDASLHNLKKDAGQEK